MSCVLFNELTTASGHKVGRMTLNAERSLNALTLDMIELMLAQLQRWQQDDAVVCVFLDGAGEKAFCAGGDVVNLYKAMTGDGDEFFPERFFTQEYRLDYLLHTYSKPLICWGHGIVMGGGMGLMSGCSHRVVTERSRLAMPEVTIGLYPDVGGSWFLNRMPGRTGLFLGLTGNSMNAADALFLGLADRFIASECRQQVLNDLCEADWQGNAQTVVASVLRQLEQNSLNDWQADSPVREHFEVINQLMDQDSVIDMVTALQTLDTDDKWLQRARQAISHGSPLAIHLIARQLQRCRHLSLKEVFQQELALSVQCCRHREFPEGVRALLVDKDGAPQWTFNTLADVDPAIVDEFFTSPWEVNPLAHLGTE
ncbi:enoyl-CoA hydratase/isomerase family protein [Aliamphritea hakodatensis]|uniref:enoyl-CoA hydratase/isomerase family protein n=1 Tax=Aliamphritea hakodatensis TaxID=2895352 RepID=UPI0022FD4A2E|nr:enoyl-CoA hydratase/isomerase family protein [Aliamphritea hakodatensis]